MTIKHMKKNISAEMIPVLYDIETKEDGSGIILTKKNFYYEDNEEEAVPQEVFNFLDYFYTKEEVDEKVKIHMVFRDSEEELMEEEGQENYIYLIPFEKGGNKEGAFKEYVWTEDDKYEQVGSTDLQPILDKFDEYATKDELTAHNNNSNAHSDIREALNNFATKEELNDKADSNHTHSEYVSASKVTNWSGTVSDNNIPSEKLVKDSLDNKQAILVSGTNIKTINNNSLLGNGNIDIQGGGGTDVGSFTELQSLITNASSGDVIVLDKDYKNAGSETGININKSLTIIGNGHIIDGDGKSRIFYITGNGCKINNLIFMNGNTSNSGGCILCGSPNNIIFNCTFINNNASNTGGAILYQTSTNSILDCSFINNTAEYGGAIFCLSPDNVIISDCEFKGNTATNDGANIYNSVDSLIVYNCHTTTGLHYTVNYDDLNSENLVTSWSGTVSDSNVPSEKLVKDTFDDLATVATSGSYSDLENKPDLATVATSGKYDDLSNKPSIPTDTNDLTNGAGYVTLDEVNGEVNLNNYYTKNEIQNGYVAKENNKGLSTNDFTDAYKDEIDNLATNYQSKGNYLTASDISGKANSADLANIATSGSYTDLGGITTQQLSITYDVDGTDVTETITFLTVRKTNS